MYLLTDSVRVSRKGNFTCPMKSAVVFVHNWDISVESCEVVKLFDDCINLDDVLKLSQNYHELIPPICY